MKTKILLAVANINVIGFQEEGKKLVEASLDAGVLTLVFEHESKKFDSGVTLERTGMKAEAKALAVVPLESSPAGGASSPVSGETPATTRETRALPEGKAVTESVSVPEKKAKTEKKKTQTATVPGQTVPAK